MIIYSIITLIIGIPLSIFGLSLFFSRTAKPIDYAKIWAFFVGAVYVFIGLSGLIK